jgi:formate dehydrogenase subunit delta
LAGHGASEAKLIPMANQIAAFFRPYPEAEARRGVAQHIADFWTPGMRRALQAVIAAGGGGLDPLIMRAFDGKTDDVSAEGDRTTIATPT